MTERAPVAGTATPARTKLVVTIDTEEDNWGSRRLSNYTCENIDEIPALQEMFDHFNVKPTYLVTYPVATDAKAVSILKRLSDAGRCEIGAHCHPWNTPPLLEENSAVNSMLCNLPADLQYAKMKSLTIGVRTAFGVDVLSFKSGRFGYSSTVAHNLPKLGYKLDTSLTPYVSWRDDHGPDFTDVSPRPFRFSSDDALQERPNGDLIEVPATIGYLQRNFARSNSIMKVITQRPLTKLRLVGVLSRLGLLNREWLSPELSSGETMIKLARSMMRAKYGILNMMFHSPSLKAGLTPFTRTRSDVTRFRQHIEEFLVFSRSAGIEPTRLSDIPNLL